LAPSGFCRMNPCASRRPPAALRLWSVTKPANTHLTITAASLTDKVREGISEYFPEGSVDRVRESIEFLCADKEFSKEWESGKQARSSLQLLRRLDFPGDRIDSQGCRVVALVNPDLRPAGCYIIHRRSDCGSVARR